MENVPNGIFLDCFKGLTEVTKQMNTFGNVMQFVLVKTEREYLKYIQRKKILFTLLIWENAI